MSKIRVGLIRCDLHGMYYGALTFKHDPIVLRDDPAGRGHAAYFYFYTHYNNARKIMVPTVSGFELARVWDEDRRQAENMARIFGKKAVVCKSFEEVSDDVDLVFIAVGLVCVWLFATRPSPKLAYALTLVFMMGMGSLICLAMILGSM